MRDIILVGALLAAPTRTPVGMYLLAADQEAADRNVCPTAFMPSRVVGALLAAPKKGVWNANGE